MRPLTVGDRRVGPGEPVFVVAELSANHRQDFDQAVRLIEAAREAGADAVKLQTYTADTLTLDSDQPWFRIGAGTAWEGRKLHDLYEEAHTPWDWQPQLKEIAEGLGLVLFSSPFDPTAVEFLESMDVALYKIASFELVDLPLLHCVAKTGKPVILSTGMASLEEIREAVDALREGGCRELALLKCTSAYPAPPEEMHLRTIPHLGETFGVPVGLSDHTRGIAVAAAAVALGAVVVEKHLTLSREDGGPDAHFSLEPEEFRQMVETVRTVEAALGEVSYETGEKEAASRIFRRSLFVVEDVARGEPLTSENVRSIRPGGGLAPKHLDAVLGRRATRDLPRGTPLSWDDLEPG